VLPDHAMRALAWRGERRFGFVARSWLVTAELERSFDLRRIKWLEGAERAAAIRPVLVQLPRLVARLHAQRVFAATLRGKNVLLQPATGRIALIDLPYARTGPALRRAAPLCATPRDPLARAAPVPRRRNRGCLPRRLSRRGGASSVRPDVEADRRAARRARRGERGAPHVALRAPEVAQAPASATAASAMWVTGHQYPREAD
jgi:hypothetical protein